MPFVDVSLGRVPAFVRPTARRPARERPPSDLAAGAAEAAPAPDGLSEPEEAPEDWSMFEEFSGVAPPAAADPPAQDSSVPAGAPQRWRDCGLAACRRRRRCERRRADCRDADRDTLDHLYKLFAHLCGEGPKPDPRPGDTVETAAPRREAERPRRARPGAGRRARRGQGEEAAPGPHRPPGGSRFRRTPSRPR